MFSNYSWDAAYANFIDSLGVMGLGMLGIFVVIGVLFGAVTLLTRLSERSSKQNLSVSTSKDRKN